MQENRKILFLNSRVFFRTLFNSFLQSDLCKVRAQDLVERVSTSIWPGTTLSLLKFPIMNPSPRKQELRRRRLISQMSWKKKEASFQRQLFNQTRDPKYLSLSGMVGSTFKVNINFSFLIHYRKKNQNCNQYLKKT